MKMSTKIWMRCESKGKPAETITMNDTTHRCILKLAEWLGKVYMGSHIVIKMARTEAELLTTQSTDIQTLSAELDAMLLGGTPESSQCPHGEQLNLHCADCKHEANQATR